MRESVASHWPFSWTSTSPEAARSVRARSSWGASSTAPHYSSGYFFLLVILSLCGDVGWRQWGLPPGVPGWRYSTKRAPGPNGKKSQRHGTALGPAERGDGATRAIARSHGSKGTGGSSPRAHGQS